MDPRQQLQELAARLESQSAIIMQLQAQLLALSTAPTSARPRPALPDPAKFDGKAYHFDTWLPAIKAKLRVDGAALGDSIAQFYYVYDRLESTVQSIVLPQLARAEEDEVWSYQSILDQLSRAYDNPNRTQEAEEKLHRIEQGNDPLPTYILRFERQLYEARGHKWSDDRKIAAFRYGLSATIKNRLAAQLELPTKYSRFLRVVQQLSSRSAFAPSAPSVPSAPSAPSTRFARPSNARSDPMDLSTLEMNAIEVPLAHARVRHASPSLTRQTYRESGACLRCGSYDHWLEECPRPARPNSASRSAGSSGKRVLVRAPDYDSDTGSQASSWKSRDDHILDQLDWAKRV
jgi:hypothetical protein